jgi:hypothetical protein
MVKRKAVSRKQPKQRKQQPKTRRSQTSKQGMSAKIAKQTSRFARISRKQIIIGLIAFVMVFDVVILSVGLLGGAGGQKVAPHSDPIALIQSQMANNKAIAEIGHDSALTFANYTNLTIVNSSSLKPIDNDLLKSAGESNGRDALYDEQIVGRILKLNSDWVSYLNQEDQSVFTSVEEGSPAQTKLAELGAHSLVAYHRLAMGEIRHSGKNYYIITQASYTLTKEGQLDIHDDVFVYKLVPQDDTMIVVDFEQIPLNTSPPPSQEEEVVPSTEGESSESIPAEGSAGAEAPDAAPESTSESASDTAPNAAEAEGAEGTPDAASDAESDAASESASDATSETESDATPETESDATPEPATETAPDVEVSEQ